MKYVLPFLFISLCSCLKHEIPDTPEYLGEKKKWHIKALTNPYITYEKNSEESTNCPKIFHEKQSSLKKKHQVHKAVSKKHRKVPNSIASTPKEPVKVVAPKRPE